MDDDCESSRVHSGGCRAWRIHRLPGRPRSDVFALIVSETMRIAVSGIVLGVTAAYLSAPWVKPLLFGESAHDPQVIWTVTLTLLAAALCAAAVPKARGHLSIRALVLRSD